MKKIVLLLSGIILSISSFNIFAKVEPENPKNKVVKKYSVGKPGYNRHVVKVYQKKVTNKHQMTSRQRMMKFRRHP